MLLRRLDQEVNVDKTRYLVMSRDHDAGKSQSMKADISSFERAEEFRYLGTTLTNQTSMQEDNKSRLKQGMLAIIRPRIFFLQVYYPKIYILR